MILKDSSCVGSKLPSEQTLAQNFGVSRNIVRESLKLLKERNLITLHTGEGAYIEKPDSKSVVNVVNRIILMDEIMPAKVFEARMLLETGACGLAVINGKPEDLIKLEEINQEMVRCDQDTERRTQLDLKFHSLIAEMTGNPLIELFVKSMATLLGPFITTALIPHTGHMEGINTHRQIIACMREKDVVGAECLMREHLENSTQNYLRAVEKQENKD